MQVEVRPAFFDSTNILVLKYLCKLCNIILFLINKYIFGRIRTKTDKRVIEYE